MHSTAPVAQQRRLAGPCAHAVGSPARAALPSAPRRRPLRCSAIKDDSSAQEQPSLRDRAATLLTGLAASAVAFSAGSTQAVEAATAAPAAQAGAAKPPMPDIPAATRSNADLQAELERRNATELSRFSGQLTTAQSSAIKGVEELQKRNAENLKAFVSELEASKAAAVKSVEELQKRVAAEHATMLQLQTELRAAKAMLDNSQKEVDKEKGLLVAAKEAAQAARKEASEAAAAARTAELALRGQAGMETLKSPLGLAAASGWTLAAIVALAKQRSPDGIDWSKVEGKDDILKAMEQARQDSDALRRESDALKRDLSTMQNTVTQLTKQLEQERNQRDTLRETILLLESEVSSMEQRMNSAKTEAQALKKKLDDVNVPTPTSKRPSLNEILTGQAAAAAKSQHSGSTSSYGSSGSSSYGSSSSPYTSNGTSSTSSYSGLGLGSSSGSSSGSSGSSSGAYSSSSSSSLGSKYDVAAAAKALGSSGRAVRVKFTLQMELPFGQSLKLVGSHPALGAWDENRGLPMTWGDGHVWTGEVPLPIGTAVEFKAVKVVGGAGAYSEWEGGSNHVLLIPDSTTTSSLAVRVEWGAGTAVLDDTGRKKEEHGKVLATAGAIGSSSASGSSSSAAKSSSGPSSSSSSSNPSTSSSTSGAGASKRSGGSNKWRGLLG
ncbi:hypothetical protein ABPG77_005464 [Micractinium sp. CCAP 211/92]